ncbi:type II toxin-antitoxin system HicB family antitoxin [Rhizobium tubonense]|uniref:HicB-like antitoxin of toxin-antitoxin system domain-containing protein n=1 Tax=Rhizobium tubonense TaxID=484088 RepID=A0A2W4C2B6_9HYPH|nr:type II toxin-antitoxin system HicB family antitoxin [Rhizobium tubonense]PZM07979.1 hypothetical protein CPY51_29955 [Rhizobium tubonense]
MRKTKTPFETRFGSSAATDYVIVIETITKADGGGYCAIVPDLKGCMAVGESYAIVIANIRAAIEEWITESSRLGYDVPLAPSALPNPFDSHM